MKSDVATCLLAPSVALHVATLIVVAWSVADRVTKVLAPGAKLIALFVKILPSTVSVSECVVNVMLPVLIAR